MNERDNKLTVKRLIPLLAAVAATVLLIIYFGEVTAALAAVLKLLSPLVIGCVIAYVLNIIMKKIMMKID